MNARRIGLQLAMFLGAVLIATPAWAHKGTGLAGGFSSGFMHPLNGADHLLAMVAVGLWGAYLGRPLLYLLPVIFPMMMVVGAVIGMIDLPVPGTELGIAVSVLTLGACIAFAARPPIIVAVGIVGAFAICHGYAHGRELPSAADPVGYSFGFVLATGCLHIFGILLGHLKNQPRGDIGVRVAGVAIAAAGVCFLSLPGVR